MSHDSPKRAKNDHFSRKNGNFNLIDFYEFIRNDYFHHDNECFDYEIAVCAVKIEHF